MDTLGFEPRAFRMRSGCDTTTPCARLTDATMDASGNCSGNSQNRLEAQRSQGQPISWKYLYRHLWSSGYDVSLTR